MIKTRSIKVKNIKNEQILMMTTMIITAVIITIIMKGMSRIKPINVVSLQRGDIKKARVYWNAKK